MATRKQPPAGLDQKQFTPIFLGNVEGLNAFNSTKAIQPNQLSDAENVFYDTGYIYNRQGSKVVYDDTTYEPTSQIIQTIVGSDSVGTQYLLRYWGGKLDVWNPTTLKWYNLNPASQTGYTTPKLNLTSSKFSYVTWNNGYGNDVWTVVNQSLGADILYLGNGTDPLIRWVMASTTLKNQLSNGDTSIVVNDSTEFPGNTGITSQPILIGGTVANYTVSTKATWLTTLTLNGNPANGDKFTLTIDGVAVTVNFTTGTETNPGDVKVQGSAALTAAAVQGLFTTPALDLSGSYKAFTDGNVWTALQKMKFTVSSAVLTGNEFTSGTITTFTSSITSAGNTLTVTTPNTFTIPAWAGGTQSVGTPVYIPMVSARQNGDYVIGGKYMQIVNGRLHSAGVKGSEDFLYYSALQMPEVNGSIGTSTGMAAGGVVELYDGDGAITALSGTLQYLLVHKKDLVNQFSLVPNQANNGNLTSFIPVASGDSAGSSNGFLTKTVNMITYFPTATQGIVTLIPQFTLSGGTYFQEKIISIPIQNIIDNVGFSLGDSIYFGSKIYFSVNETLPINQTTPNLVLYYNLLNDSWGKIRGWGATSFVEYGGNLIFSSSDTYLYQAESNYDDNGFAYESYAQTGELSFGDISKLKDEDTIVLTGTINLGGKLYVDVDCNANGQLATLTYEIDGDPVLTYNNFVNLQEIGMNQIGVPTIAWANPNDTIGLFKVYLTNNIKYKWNTVQLKFYSKDIGAQWSVDSCSMHVYESEARNPDLVLYPK